MSEGPAKSDSLIDQLLGEPRVMRRQELLERAGVPRERSRGFWLALGFPAVDEDVVPAYTEADLRALKAAEALLRDRLDLPLALSMTRGLGRTIERLASWQVSVALETVLEQETGLDSSTPVDDLAERLAESTEPYQAEKARRVTPEHVERVGRMLLGLNDEFVALLGYTFQRHLAGTIEKLRTEAEAADAPEGADKSVGFADIVGFTNLVNQLSERQLAALVQGFEELATDVVVSHAGRVVKTLGDEVVFVADGPAAAGAIALDLAEGMQRDAGLPRLRIGLASGGVLSHLGDIFGTTVNRASRLAGVARPDTVVIDDNTFSVLGSAPDFATSQMQPRMLRGLGMTSVWQLRRAPQ